jgi:hypothetical protein
MAAVRGRSKDLKVSFVGGLLHQLPEEAFNIDDRALMTALADQSHSVMAGYPEIQHTLADLHQRA